MDNEQMMQMMQAMMQNQNVMSQMMMQMMGQSISQGVAAATQTIHTNNNDQVAALQAQIASLQKQLQAANQQLSDIKAQLPDKSVAMLSRENPTTGKNYTLAEVVGVELDADVMLRDTIKQVENRIGHSIYDFLDKVPRSGANSHDTYSEIMNGISKADREKVRIQDSDEVFDIEDEARKEGLDFVSVWNKHKGYNKEFQIKSADSDEVSANVDFSSSFVSTNELGF